MISSDLHGEFFEVRGGTTNELGEVTCETF
jgi:hypothetical protein